MAWIDSLKWEPKSNNEFAWKYPENNLSTYTQLVVHETQEAVLFTKGQLLAKFGPGKHTLDTENIPILRNLFGIPFGGKNPFTAEVWFVNKASPLNLPWATDTMRYKDPAYNAMVPLRAEGSYGLQVADAERFLLKLVGTLSRFDSGALAEHFRGELVSKTKSAIIAKMSQDRIGILDISAYLSSISDSLQGVMTAFWEEQGFRLVKFYVTSVDVDDSTADGAQILQSITNRASREIEGVTYQQEKVLGALQNSTGMGLGLTMGIGMGQNLGGGFLNPVSANPAPQASSTGPGAGVGVNPIGGPGLAVFCAKCGTKTGGAKFCPSCGKGYNPCPNCGADNLAGAVKCVICSRPLGQACPQCKTPLVADTKFCPECGYSFKKVCSKCHAEWDAEKKYCPTCGTALGGT